MPLPDEDQRRLRAALARIIPADDTPGALELGVDAYVLARLDAEHAADAEAICAGLAELELRARVPLGTFGVKQFDTLLASVERHHWFIVLAELTAEGCYADPGNGGNRNGLAWQLIGYEPRLPAGRLA